ncbi:MAG: TonB-dependent receptor [Sphingomonadales bacterium]|nr:TonB-dependent receptor [Sphingomonadales bacterium]
MAGFTPTGVPVPPIGAGCAPLDNTTLDGTPATYLPGEFRDTLAEHNVSWRAGVDYKAAPGVLLYANIAKGYKAGSFPIASAATFEQFLPVVQESLLSYEAGFKLSSSDRRFNASGAAFSMTTATNSCAVKSSIRFSRSLTPWTIFRSLECSAWNSTQPIRPPMD